MGAEVTGLSDATFNSIQNSVPQLEKSNQTIRGSNRIPLEVIGETSLKLTYKGKSSVQRVFVIKNLQNNLLGFSAIKALELIRGFDAITQNISDQYPTLFSGLGTFKGEYAIKLQPDAKPFCLFTPRNIPLPLLEKVHKEMRTMNGKARCHFSCRRAHSMVCCHGSCTKTVRFNSHMCRLETFEQKRDVRDTPSSKGRHHTCPADTQIADFGRYLW